MAVAVSYPGVYVREEASGARAIGGVATSVALFVGQAEQGPMDQPTRIFSVADFERAFGATTKGELATQVRQFYVNGGGEAWIMRIADGADQAAVTLRAIDESDALVVTARDAGLLGNRLRVEIDYATASPEETFNLTVYRRSFLAGGRLGREDEEAFTGLSMDPNAGNFVERVINGVSALVTVKADPVATVGGVSLAARVLRASDGDALADLQAMVTPNANALRLQVAGHAAVPVALTPASDAGGDVDAMALTWQGNMNQALSNAGIGASVVVAVTAVGDADQPDGGVAGGRLLRITSAAGPVRIAPAAANDVTAALQLGVAAGGLEGSTFGDARPAPNGIVSRVGTSVDRFSALRMLAGVDRGAVDQITLVDDSPDTHAPIALDIGAAGTRIFQQGTSRSLANVRGVLEVLGVNLSQNTSRRWAAARQGWRLGLRPLYGGDDTGLAAMLTVNGVITGTSDLVTNVLAYTVGLPGGTAGAGSFQFDAEAGDDGDIPQPDDYARAYAIADREVPLFNLLVLPRSRDQDEDQRQGLWGPASAFCAHKRAFLLVDPRADWRDLASADDGVDLLRIGVETRNSAAYWPRLRIHDGTREGRVIDPAGSIAGLMARTDATRGVWKAPAGLEATIRGVTGLERRLTDDDNGVINPKALNALRVFSAGVVSWGARTLVGFDGSGNIDDKYVPVRRTMLFIEESLYRGLQFAVFEPNDEPLWAQIRLAAGSFMNGLFRQGAFAGSKASDAYFVACDASTTTASDINLGIVNVVVGFAPLKPAEFVILTVKQLAGQAEV
ncbi:DUF2586 family protein [Thioalkalicoccus limnaeus]|uniref:DUF2586 family protein n=1 Tax=Thioalkalicoccus limnaeus TaxID=120681 RepID=A0ABV4BKQ0_9GAMM